MRFSSGNSSPSPGWPTSPRTRSSCPTGSATERGLVSLRPPLDGTLRARSTTTDSTVNVTTPREPVTKSYSLASQNWRCVEYWRVPRGAFGHLGREGGAPPGCRLSAGSRLAAARGVLWSPRTRRPRVESSRNRILMGRYATERAHRTSVLTCLVQATSDRTSERRVELPEPSEAHFFINDCVHKLPWKV